MFILLIHAVRTNAEEAYVICYPESTVVVREHPKKTALATGELTAGHLLHLDGKQKNGYYHCIDMANESGDGWVSKLYITFEEPIFVNLEARVISKGRLAARTTINGERKKWLYPDEWVVLYYWTSEWCVTNYGYVKTKYLEID